MEGIGQPSRAPCQGVWNILRFNWHFYLLAAGLFLALLALGRVLPYSTLAAAFLLASTFLSLLVSWYVYDLSGLYQMRWCGECPLGATLVNVHAGFDETSGLLRAKYPDRKLIVLDFYDPAKHTEVSIRRARKACPPFPGTRPIDTASVPLPERSADLVLLVFAAHEIREDAERVVFFRELNRILKPAGRIVVVEQLRDLPNFLAYTIGCFHFLPRSTWRKTFRAAGLKLAGESKVNPFVTAFVLEQDGTAT